MPRNLVEARHETSRKEIVAAARRLFAERGVRATSLAAIAAEVGINKATLYYYYPAKNDLVVDTVREYAADYLADILRPLPDGLSAQDAIWRRFEYKLDRWERTGPLDSKFFYTVMLEELDEPVVEQVYRDFWDWGRSEALEILRRGQQAGEVRAEADPDALVTVMTATSMGIDLLWLNDPDRVDYAAAHRLAIDNLLHSLAP